MTDVELLAGFEACTLAEFHHADHVRVAWTILRQTPSYDAALARFCASLQRFAAAAGQPAKYDDALTRRYMERIHERMGPESWEAFAAANPDLLVWRKC